MAETRLGNQEGAPLFLPNFGPADEGLSTSTKLGASASSDWNLLFGFMWYAHTGKTNNLILLIGFLAIIGSFMLSYTADKYDNLMRSRTRGGFAAIRVGRDIRVFLIFLAALTGWVHPFLWMIAAVMNAETLRRIWVCRDHQ